MCGIAGIVKFKAGPIDYSDIDRLTGNLKHRGPDGQGKWFNQDRSVVVGHTRLSILDLSDEAAQPMLSNDQRFVLVFNGEIYNFVELSLELEQKGHQFCTQSDSEVVLAAYQQWGNGAFDRFNGMWALAIYDRLENRLLLCRDRFGVKPLYYYVDKEMLVFASEIQAIHKFIPGRVSPNWSFLQSLIKFDVSAYGEKQTYLNEVKAVRPGFVTAIDYKSVSHQQWFWLARITVPASYADQVSRFRELIQDACRVRLRSDVPVATCLSGGVDSGSIVSLLSEFKNPESQRFNHFSHAAFTAGFPGADIDETHSARMVADQKGMSFALKVVNPPNADELERGIDACDGPMPSLAFFPIWKLYEHIKSQGVSVTLDGQGADEMLGGYYLGYPAMRGAMQTGSIAMLYDLFDTYGNLQQGSKKRIHSDFRRALRDTYHHWDQLAKAPVKDMAAKMGWYQKRPSRLPKPASHPVWVRDSFDIRKNALQSGLIEQFFKAPLPYLLHQYDRCSMASGVECRMPFMDFRLVQYVFSLPLRSRIGKGFTKRILRDAVKGTLYEPIRANKTKKGFNAPFGQWIGGPLKSWALDMINTEEFRDLPDTDVSRCRRLIEESGGVGVNGSLEWNIWPRIHTAFWLRQTKGYINAT